MVIMVASSPQYFAYKKKLSAKRLPFFRHAFLCLHDHGPESVYAQNGRRQPACRTRHPRRRACAQAAGHLPCVWARQCGHAQPSAVPATACCTAIDSPTFCAPIPTSLLAGLWVVPCNPCLRQHMPCSTLVCFPTHSALNQSVIRTCMPKGSPRRRRQHYRHMCYYRCTTLSRCCANAANSLHSSCDCCTHASQSSQPFMRA